MSPSRGDRTISDFLSYSRTGRKPAVRRLRRVGAGLLAAAVAIAVVAVAAIGSLWLSLAGIQRDAGLMPSRAAALPSSGMPGSLNLLLVGSASRQTRGDADVLMLVHLDAARRDVHLVSLPRDLMVDRADAEPARLSRVYAEGGSVAAVEAVERLLRLRVDHVALTYLAGMSRLIDLVDGIPVDNPVAFRNGAFSFPRGPITLRGDEALAFVQQGPPVPGELDRAESQRLVLQGLVTRLLSSPALNNPGRIKAVLDQLASDVVVDSSLDARRMVELFVGVRTQQNAQELETIKLPTSQRGTTPSGEGFVLPDEVRVRSLGQALNTDTVSAWVRGG